MPDDATAVLRRALDALTRRDLDAVVAAFAEDAELDWTASRNVNVGLYHGRDALIGFVRDYWETFDEMLLTPDEFLERGDVVVAAMRARFRRADGLAADTHFALVATVRAGRIVRLRMEQGLAEALDTLGPA